MKPIALVDLDGTLADYNGQLSRDMTKLVSPTEVDYPFSAVHDNHAPDYIKARKTVITSQEGWWKNLDKYKPGMEILQVLVNIGFDIEILTKGPRTKPAAWKEKVEWCSENLNCNYKMNIVQDKGLVYGRVLVDDYPDYIVAWLKHRPRGLVIMPDHTYNRDYSHPNVYRYTGNVIELTEILLKAYKRKESNI